MAVIVNFPQVRKTSDVESVTDIIPDSAVIVQARMTSRRFPGKSLEKLASRTIIGHCLHRCLKIGNIGKVILATSEEPESMRLISFVQNEFPGVHIYAGDATNVLSRYYEIAQQHELKYIMRVTGDCPFIDPALCASVMSMLYSEKLNYCSNVYPTRTFHKGLDCEAFTFETLEAAYAISVDDQYLDERDVGDTEHVTPWMQRSNAVDRGTILNKNKRDPLYNWCVDYPHDISRLQTYINDGVIKL